ACSSPRQEVAMVSDWPRRRRSRAACAASSAALSFTGSGAGGGGGGGGGDDPKIPPMVWSLLLAAGKPGRSLLTGPKIEHLRSVVKVYFLETQKKFPWCSDPSRMQPDQALDRLDAGGRQGRGQLPGWLEDRNRQGASAVATQMGSQVDLAIPMRKMADFPHMRQRLEADPALIEAQPDGAVAESGLQTPELAQPGFLADHDHRAIRPAILRPPHRGRPPSLAPQYGRRDPASGCRCFYIITVGLEEHGAYSSAARSYILFMFYINRTQESIFL